MSSSRRRRMILMGRRHLEDACAKQAAYRASGKDGLRLKTENHLAVVCGRDGAVLASAWNKCCTRSKCGCGSSDYTMHAEMAALKKLGDLRRLRGSIMLVARVTRGGSFAASSPCPECRVKLLSVCEKWGLK